MLKIWCRSIKIWPSYGGLKFREPTTRFGVVRAVWYGNGGVGGESIFISLILWVYAENFVQIHQDLAELWRFEVQRAYYIQWRSPIQLLTFYDIHNFYQPQYQCHSGPVVRALAHFSCVLCVMSSNPQWV